MGDLVNFKGFSIKAKATEAEIYLYDEIGSGFFGGVSANDFKNELTKAGKVQKITLRLNSPGGDVFDGIAIYNLLKQNAAQVEVFVDGLAASIASIIAMAGDQIYVAENSMMMIHDPWSIGIGSAADMRDLADRLDKVGGLLSGTYAKRTGQDEQTIVDMMAQETWMSGAEAIEKGFADALVDEMPMAAHFDLAKFKFKHNPFTSNAVQEPAPPSPSPDLSCFDRGIERCKTILRS